MSINASSGVVVLGGTSGIGLATARSAAERGARVVIASRRPESVERALADLPGPVTGRSVDASDDEDLRTFFEWVGQFDHLVYTAGESLPAVPLAQYRPETGRDFFGLRVVHAFNALRHAVPRIRPNGSITLTSGTAAWRGGPGWLLGAAASGAIASAVRTLAVELAPIRVNAVAPGVVRSPLWALMSEPERELMYEQIGSGLPLGRVGEVQDVAKAYLALMDQDWVTGTISVVDGGTLVA